jgi:peptide methionine sulfoxide reductase MsrB
LGEITGNLQGRKAVGKSSLTQRRKKSVYGCTTCNKALCKEGNCFNSHVNSL